MEQKTVSIKRRLDNNLKLGILSINCSFVLKYDNSDPKKIMCLVENGIRYRVETGDAS